jgi:hypothetical protein
VRFSEESPGWSSVYSGGNGRDRDPLAIVIGPLRDESVFQDFSRRRAFGGTARSGTDEKQECGSADGMGVSGRIV